MNNSKQIENCYLKKDKYFFVKRIIPFYLHLFICYEQNYYFILLYFKLFNLLVYYFIVNNNIITNIYFILKILYIYII